MGSMPLQFGVFDRRLDRLGPAVSQRHHIGATGCAPYALRQYTRKLAGIGTHAGLGMKWELMGKCLLRSRHEFGMIMSEKRGPIPAEEVNDFNFSVSVVPIVKRVSPGPMEGSVQAKCRKQLRNAWLQKFPEAVAILTLEEREPLRIVLGR